MVSEYRLLVSSVLVLLLFVGCFGPFRSNCNRKDYKSSSASSLNMDSLSRRITTSWAAVFVDCWSASWICICYKNSLWPSFSLNQLPASSTFTPSSSCFYRSRRFSLTIPWTISHFVTEPLHYSAFFSYAQILTQLGRGPPPHSPTSASDLVLLSAWRLGK